MAAAAGAQAREAEEAALGRVVSPRAARLAMMAAQGAWPALTAT